MALSVKSPRETAAAPKERTYKPTKADLAAFQKGEAAFAKGEFVTLTEFLNEMDRSRRAPRAKTDRKVPR